MSQIPLKDLLAVATEAAHLGGRRTLAYFNTGVTVETKADASPVTRADKESEELIRAHIARHFPDHEVIGEEGGTKKGDSRYRWIVDPLDGTKTFICGVPFFGTLIGVEVEGRASVGVIYLPAFDELICAASGMGCTWNGRTCSVSKTSKLSDAVLLTTSVATCQARSDAYDRLARATKIHRTWGDCYGYALVATGRAEIMLDPQMNPWDCAPMLAIMQEAGGHFTTWDGEATIWGKDAAATNAALNREVLDILKNETRRA
ncbi:MAG TPA: histidinol-phosphatase [Planctomycetota bacterium]|nr:histidinol-phosphatase [Planctomycetota bacterium]